MSCITTAALVVTLASTHHVAGDFNETNPGLGIQVPVHECVSVEAGAFRNSYDRTSKYAGIGYERRIARWLSVGAIGGLISGYRDKEVSSPVLAALTVSVGTQRLNVRALHVPARVTGFQVRVGF